MSLVIMLVAYYPERQALAAWSKAVQGGVPLRIWDNTPEGCRFKDEFPELEFMGQGENLGVGPAIQRLLNLLDREGRWDKALYWDQDAQWTIESYQWVEALQDNNLLELYKNNKSLVGIRNHVHFDRCLGNPIPVPLLITNGMIFPVQAAAALLNAYQPFRMECADYQLCYKASLEGWTLYAVSGCPDLKHDPTHPSLAWSNGFKTFRKRIYPVGRSRRFLLNLAALALDALSRLNFLYFGVFLRNILTHIAYRSWFNAMWYFRPAGRQT